MRTIARLILPVALALAAVQPGAAAAQRAELPTAITVTDEAETGTGYDIVKLRLAAAVQGHDPATVVVTFANDIPIDGNTALWLNIDGDAQPDLIVTTSAQSWAVNRATGWTALGKDVSDKAGNSVTVKGNKLAFTFIPGKYGKVKAFAVSAGAANAKGKTDYAPAAKVFSAKVRATRPFPG